MSTTEPINIPINGKDNVTPVTKKITMSLRDMGEKISSIGMQMSAAFTLPLVLGVKSVISFGATASKELATLQANLSKAIAGGNVDEIAAATAEMNALAPATREAAAAYDEMQAAMKPVNDEISSMKAQLLEALVPVLKDLMPTLKGVVDYVKGLADGFSALSSPQKEAVIGAIGFFAVLGPGLVILGNVIKTVGTLQMLLPGLSKLLIANGEAAWASLGPYALLAGAVILLAKVINDNWGTISKLLAIGGSLVGIDPRWAANTKDTGGWNLSGLSEQAQSLPGFASGGRFFAGQPFIAGERGPEVIMPMSGGSVIPNGGSTYVLNYSPAIGLGDRAEVQRIWDEYTMRTLHAKGIA